MGNVDLLEIVGETWDYSTVIEQVLELMADLERYPASMLLRFS